VEDRDGSLWMRTETADLVRFRDGRFARFGAERGFAGRLYGVSLDTEGAVWIRMVDGLGRIDGERFIPVAEEAIRGAVWGLVRRRDGSVWVSTGPTGFFRIEGGRTERIVTGTALDSTLIIGMAEDSAGVLWLYTQNDVWEEVESGLRQLGSTEPGSAIRAGFRPRPHTRLVLAGRRAYPIEAYPGQAPQEAWIAGAVDAEGALWYVAGSRLYRQGALAWDLGRVLGRTGEDVELTAIAIDREGSIWLGTFNAGLHRLKPALFATYSQPEGVANARVTTVYEDRSGAIWAGTWGGLSRIDGHGRVETWTTLAGRRAVFSLSSDRPDRLWVGTDAGLLSCSLPAVDCRSVDAPAALRGHIYALYSDTRGRLWVGAGSSVARFEDGHWIMLDSKPGTAPVRAFAETADGALWMGTNGDGLIRYAHGRYTRIDQSDGLPSDLVRALYVDAEGWLWVGTEGRGLARLDPRAWADGAGGAGGADIAASRRIVHVGVEHGLYDPVIHQILEDDAGRLWMSTNRGIFWVPRAELNAFAEGRAARIHSTHYTERDGMRNREANGGVQPAGVRARDGRLWFPTQDGVVVTDPARVAVARVPSPPVVERVVAGDSSYVAAGEPIRLGVDERDVQIEYTAPSFLEPANIRFRYRLDPYDADWVDAGRRRSAFYTRLPPGRYSFTVSASSHGGVWSDVGAPLELVVTPRFQETRAARLLLVVTLMLLAAGGVQWRLRSLRRRERELTRLVDERTAELRRNEVQLAAQNAHLAEQAERLAELDQLKSRLFANISHEFRTPLTLILCPLRSMLDGRHGALPPAVREQAQLMLRNGQRLLRLINQLLDLTRLQAGQLTLRRRTHDLVSFTRGITLAFAPLAE